MARIPYASGLGSDVHYDISRYLLHCLDLSVISKIIMNICLESSLEDSLLFTWNDRSCSAIKEERRVCIVIQMPIGMVIQMTLNLPQDILLTKWRYHLLVKLSNLSYHCPLWSRNKSRVAAVQKTVWLGRFIQSLGVVHIILIGSSIHVYVIGNMIYIWIEHTCLNSNSYIKHGWLSHIASNLLHRNKCDEALRFSCSRVQWENY